MIGAMTVALYLLSLAARAALASRYASRRFTADDSPVTIIQPILSGDPLLEKTLQRNLLEHPRAQFLWMIDEDDAEAQRIAARLKVPGVLCPPPRDGENPKLAKLIQALPLVTTQRLIVLDDDTELPSSSALPGGALVTGLPVFASNTTVYERLIGGFVNGSALLTYLPAAQLKLQRTINGMIYSVDTAQLRDLGGFSRAGHELTDDYAVARLYLRNGQTITQAIAPAFVTMTLASAPHYIRVMRRWMIFATHYFGRNATLATIFWIALPAMLPIVGLAFAPASSLLALFVKALINRILLYRITGVMSTPLDLMFECAADLLTPVWMLLAMIQPSRLTWRSRNIELKNGAIRYK